MIKKVAHKATFPNDKYLKNLIKFKFKLFTYLILLLSGIFYFCHAEEAVPGSTTRQKIDTLRAIPADYLIAKSPYPKLKKKKQLIPDGMKQKISISINDTLPLKQAFLTLSEQTKIDLQLDPDIKNSLVFSAYNRPLIDIIHDICELAELRYSIVNNSIRIEQDTPYPANYNAQFLNMARSSKAQVSIATDVFSSTKEGQGNLDNGSNSTVSAKSDNDFWEEVAGNLETILNDGNDSSFTIHKQGGIISVRATSRQHKLIDQYLENLKRAISTQVLIEAKVIEVNLKDEFKAGINWQKLTGGITRIDMPLGTIAQHGTHMDPSTAQQQLLSFGIQQHDFSSIVKAIQQFGSCETLSSPRLTVLNNQQAILKVAQNQVYFRLKYDKEYNINIERESINVSSDIQTVPIGLVMAVQPSIDHETGEIILSLRPTISRLSRSVSDPAVAIALANSKDGSITNTPSLIPVVEVREIDSVLRIASGEVAVLGGLMESRNNIENAKVPIAGDLPLIGKLFTAESEVNEVVELVILLKATIVKDNETISSTDIRLINEYSQDPRPFS